MSQKQPDMLTMLTPQKFQQEYLSIKSELDALRQKLEGRKLVFANHYYNSLEKNYTTSAIFAGFGNTKESAKVAGSRQSKDADIIRYWELSYQYSMLMTGKSIDYFKENIFGPSHVLALLVEMTQTDNFDMRKYAIDKFIDLYEMMPEKIVKTENTNRNLTGDLTEFVGIVKARQAHNAKTIDMEKGELPE